MIKTHLKKYIIILTIIFLGIIILSLIKNNYQTTYTYTATSTSSIKKEIKESTSINSDEKKEIKEPTSINSDNKIEQLRLLINNTHIVVELATTSAQIIKGLSGRLSLEPDHGMLFIFSQPSIYRFWMPDMHFPLDMIWINNNKVVDISHNVSNDFDPVNPTYYKPKEPAQYVLEVNANFSKKNNIKIGDIVKFENILVKQIQQ
jgi:uncharacterized membrane protein (UPF0127 family)